MYAKGEFCAYTIVSMGYAYTGDMARVVHIDGHPAACRETEKGQQMGYGETVMVVCVGTVAFVLFFVAAAWAAVWILDGIDHK